MDANSHSARRNLKKVSVKANSKIALHASMRNNVDPIVVKEDGMQATIKQIQKAMTNWSIEVTPASANKINKFSDCLVPGTTVNVTFLPGSDPMDTVVVSERLHNEGMNPVPHIAARSLRDADHINALLAAYTSRAAVNEVLVIGGGVDQPIGAFSNSMQVLEMVGGKENPDRLEKMNPVVSEESYTYTFFSS